MHFLKGAAIDSVSAAAVGKAECSLGVAVAKLNKSTDDIELILGAGVLSNMEGEDLSIQLGEAGLLAGETTLLDTEPACHSDGHAVAEVGIVRLGGRQRHSGAGGVVSKSEECGGWGIGCGEWCARQRAGGGRDEECGEREKTRVYEAEVANGREDGRATRYKVGV